MSGDVCRTKKIEVVVQENGYIRDSQGWGMGRLTDDYSFEAIVEKKEKKKVSVGALFILLAAMLGIFFTAGILLGHAAAWDQPCAATCNVPESIR